MGQTWRNGGQISEQPEFRLPVHQCQAEPSGPCLSVGGGGLPKTAGDSCGLALPGYLVERAPVAIQSGLPARQILPAGDNSVDILRINL